MWTRLARDRGEVGLPNRVRTRPGMSGRRRKAQRELEALFNEQNTSADRDVTTIPATFPRVTVAG
jgi:hypothetical protein